MSNLSKVLAFFGFGVVALVLGGCMPHLTMQQCKTMNWYQVGYNDALHGKPQRDLSSAISDCAKFKLTVNTSKYRQGWKAGARQYCNPKNGYQLGTQGQVPADICPIDLAGSFKNAWRRGLRAYCTPSTGYNLGRAGRPMPNFCTGGQGVAFRNAYVRGARILGTEVNIESQIKSLNDQVGANNALMNSKRGEINTLNNRLDNSAGRPFAYGERRQIRGRIRQLRREIEGLQNQNAELQSQKASLQQQFNSVQAE